MIAYLLAVVGGYLIGDATKDRQLFAKGGNVLTKVKDIPNLEEKIKSGMVTYRGLGFGESGKKIKVEGKEYLISDEEFNKISRDKDGKLMIRFSAPSRKYAKGGRICPVGTEVQTLIFDKDEFNEKSAKSWAKNHDFKYGYVDSKENTHRIRQQEPDEFKADSFRTIDITKGVKAVIGCPKKK